MVCRQAYWGMRLEIAEGLCCESSKNYPCMRRHTCKGVRRGQTLLQSSQKLLQLSEDVLSLWDTAAKWHKEEHSTPLTVKYLSAGPAEGLRAGRHQGDAGMCSSSYAHWPALAAEVLSSHL